MITQTESKRKTFIRMITEHNHTIKPYNLDDIYNHIIRMITITVCS